MGIRVNLIKVVEPLDNPRIANMQTLFWGQLRFNFFRCNCPETLTANGINCAVRVVAMGELQYGIHTTVPRIALR